MTRILVVDDDAVSRKLTVELLGYEGYETFEARDGAEGLQRALAERPRLIISDILMPTMDGYEFVRRLRAAPDLAATSVIFYTANYHERAAHALAQRCDVEHVLIKPCKSAEFLRVIKATLTHAPVDSHATPDPSFDVEHLQLLTNKLSGTADELRGTNARLAALVDLNLQLASVRDPRQLLEHVCAGARNLLGARFAVLAVGHRPEGTASIVALSGLEESIDAPVRLDKGLVGRVLKLRRAARAANASKPLADVGLPAVYPQMNAVLVAPIHSLTRSYGWLCLADRLGTTEFTADDEQLLGILTAQVGRIYENGSLYVEVQNHAAKLLVEMDERERAVAGLRASEELFRQLAENIQDVMFIASKELQELFYVSPAFETIWGQPRPKLIEHLSVWTNALHPDDRDQTIREQLRIAQALPARGELEYRIVRPDGSVRWLLSRIFPMVDEHGAVVRAVGITSDVTERKLAENRVVHLNRVYAMLSGINSLIVRVTSLDELLREACRLALDAGHFGIAWCVLFDPPTGAIRSSAWAGELRELESHFHMTSQRDALPADLMGPAVASRRPVICNDLSVQSTADDTCRMLLEHGYQSAVALPLVIAEQCVGSLLLVTSEQDYFDEEEMRLLTELSGDISFAVDHIEKADRLNYLAYYDALTGLANRSLFLERVGQHVAAEQRGGSRFALVLADPERFAALNDALGRTAADQLLRDIAARFARCAGGDDLVGRVGSDQLAAILPSRAGREDLTGALEDLWTKWLAEPFEAGGQNVTLAARAGIALYPVDGTDAETLMRNAEAALSSAKSSNRTFGTYTAELSEHFSQRLALEKNLRRALEHEEFVLHYQPKVDVATRNVLGLEALLRWQSPQLGLVLPNQFIPVVEENGLIVEIGAWALRQASIDYSRWSERGLSAPRVAVNVSTVQLLRDDFVRKVTNIVRLGGREAGIDIEVTESLLMDDVSENIQKLAAIRELGIQIALDDFGTGYSSLAYLARLPVHILKIDRSFIASMLDDPGAMTLVSTIISLARALKLETVAEGVESEEQAKILRLLQCDQMQGFLISKPLPFDAMTNWLGRARGQ